MSPKGMKENNKLVAYRSSATLKTYNTPSSVMHPRHRTIVLVWQIIARYTQQKLRKRKREDDGRIATVVLGRSSYTCAAQTLRAG